MDGCWDNGMVLAEKLMAYPTTRACPAIRAYSLLKSSHELGKCSDGPRKESREAISCVHGVLPERGSPNSII